jgi:hypothetical protein
MFTVSPIKMGRYGAVVVMTLAPHLALAQPPSRSFTDLRSILAAGDAVQVMDSSGRTTRGRITGISTDALSLTVDGRQRVFPEATIQTVTKRRPDPWWNGALWGAAAGAVAGTVIAGVNCGSTDCGEGGLVHPGFELIFGAIGAGGGALVDRFISRFDPVFARSAAASAGRLRLSPVLSKGMKGVELSVSF